MRCYERLGGPPRPVVFVHLLDMSAALDAY